MDTYHVRYHLLEWDLHHCFDGFPRFKSLNLECREWSPSGDMSNVRVSISTLNNELRNEACLIIGKKSTILAAGDPASTVNDPARSA